MNKIMILEMQGKRKNLISPFISFHQLTCLKIFSNRQMSKA